MIRLSDLKSRTAQVDHLSVHLPKALRLCYCRVLWAAVQVAPFVRSSAGLRGHMCRGSLPEHLSELIKGRWAISELGAAPQPRADPPSSVCLSLYNVSTICFFLHLFLWLFFSPPSVLFVRSVGTFMFLLFILETDVHVGVVPGWCSRGCCGV